jgi:hypothetical protein
MGRRTGLPQNDHHRAIGMLETGMTINDVAVSFGVYHTTIWRLAQSFRTTGAVKYRSRSGRTNIFTLREERYIRITARTMLSQAPLVSPSTFYRPTMLTHYPGRVVLLIWLQSNIFGTC